MADNFVLLTAASTKIEIWQSAFGSWTTIPFTLPAGASTVRCIAGVIDDIWVGGERGNAPYDKPWMKHWNGSTWTTHYITDQGTSSLTTVGAIYYVSADEVYCLANDNFGNEDARLYRWDGSTWTPLGTTQLGGVWCQMYRDGSARLFVSGEKYAVYDRYYRYDAGLFNDSDGDGSANCGAVHGRNDELYSLKSNGKLRCKVGGGAWSQIGVNAGGTYQCPCLQVTDSYVWSSYSGHLVRRDRVTGANADDSATGGATAQFIVFGDGAHQFAPHTSGVRHRIDFSSWATIDRGARATALGGYTLSDTTPPALSARTPSPGAIAGRSATVSLDLTKIGGVFGLDATATEIYVGGVLVWQSGAAQNGWTTTVTAITDGLHYECAPPSRAARTPVVVRVLAADVGGNTLDESWAYLLPPRERPMSPYSIDISDGQENTVDEYGQLVQDQTVASRVRFRLLCHRGQWWADSEVGSHLHELQTLKDARARCQAIVDEALQPLVQEGAVLSTQVASVAQDPETGLLAADIVITVPEGDPVRLESVPVGR